MPAADEARVPLPVHCMEMSPSRSVHQHQLSGAASLSPEMKLGQSWSAGLKCKLWGIWAAVHSRSQPHRCQCSEAAHVQNDLDSRCNARSAWCLVVEVEMDGSNGQTIHASHHARDDDDKSKISTGYEYGLLVIAASKVGLSLTHSHTGISDSDISCLPTETLRSCFTSEPRWSLTNGYLSVRRTWK